MLKLLLKKLNFEADTAENGRVAVEMILRNPEQYYLVFMDNLMPELVRQTDRQTFTIVLEHISWLRGNCELGSFFRLTHTEKAVNNILSISSRFSCQLICPGQYNHNL